MTKGELISQVKNELRVNNADNGMTNRFIWSIINKHLSWLIKRESGKLRLIKQDTIFQTMKCVEVEPSPAIDECCGIRSKCFVYRTVEKLPDIFEDSDGTIIKSVFTIDGSKDFSPIKVSEYMRKLENPHSKYDKSLYYFYNNGYLYFPKSKIKKVMIKAYFIDEVVNDCEGAENVCISNLDTKVRIPGYLLGELMNQVLTELSSLTLKLQNDEQIDKSETRKN